MVLDPSGVIDGCDDDDDDDEILLAIQFRWWSNFLAYMKPCV